MTGNEFFRTITEEILDYVAREMLGPEGVQMLRMQHLPSSSSSAGTAGFYSTQDADSEGEEGKFFVWTPAEIREILKDDADDFMAAYGVTRHGNASTGSAHGFEGKNILEFVGDMDQRPALAEARRKLFGAREKRVHPGRDDVRWRPRQLPSNAADPVGRIAAVPLLLDRDLVDGRAAAYVCRDFTCQAPVTEPEGLRGHWSKTHPLSTNQEPEGLL